MNDKNFDTLIADAQSTREKLFLSAVELFSRNGYDAVGIRELCSSINVKESAFYNHFPSKENLLHEIFQYYRNESEKTALGEGEIEEAIASGTVGGFFAFIVGRFESITGQLVFRRIRRIVVMESYTNPDAGELARRNLYQVRREFTEEALARMSARGQIGNRDIAQVTAAFYYGLIGLLDEYLLEEVWDEVDDGFRARMGRHIAFFSEILSV